MTAGFLAVRVIPALVTFNLYPSSAIVLSVVNKNNMDLGNGELPALMVVLYPVGGVICAANNEAIFVTASLLGTMMLMVDGKMKLPDLLFSTIETGCGIKAILLVALR